MRYTTIIDISEIPAVNRNLSAKLLYIQMALKAGYHDDDRDIVDASIRHLAMTTGITFSACRHALRVLEAAQLIRREGDAWIVKKWLPAQAISARPKKVQENQEQREAEARIREKQERKEAREREKARELEAQGKTQFMLYYEGLQQKAASGDTEAQKLLKKHEATYIQHRQKMEEKQHER